jgi:glycosyltransferase involved in cell wall biosynthesis
MKKILFLSGLDFKEKSIQVIVKTPEAYVNDGWIVDYVVARDNCPNGNYFYENEINPLGVNVNRLYWPFPVLRTTKNRFFSLLLSKISSIITIFNLFKYAKNHIKKVKYDVIYGYELQGVLALMLLKILTNFGAKTVTRFQGTFLNEMFENKQYLRILFNLDLFLAIKSKSDLIIMTNDGTRGDKALTKIKGNTIYNSRFWVNGVDEYANEFSNEKIISKPVRFLSVSRLVGWKRVDRGIQIIKSLVDSGFENLIYTIVGEGECRCELEDLVKELNLQKHVIFAGGIKNSEVKNYFLDSNFFISMYDSSNVGNPLLEAIRSHNCIITLDNGDTADWVVHKKNGLIYNPKFFSPNLIAEDILEVLKNGSTYSKIISEIKITEKEKLWTWSDRLKAEIEAVHGL